MGRTEARLGWRRSGRQFSRNKGSAHVDPSELLQMEARGAGGLTNCTKHGCSGQGMALGKAAPVTEGTLSWEGS